MNRISPATVTFGLMALVLGLVAVYVVRQALHKPPVVQAPPPAPEPLPQVTVARVNIPKNTRISEQDVSYVNVPKDSPAAKEAVVNPMVAVGRITKQAIRAGQGVRDAWLLPIGEGLPEITERIPAGLRALTIDVEGAETGGRRLEEGDKIDIALTIEGTHPDLGEVTTKTLLKDVLVVDAAADAPLQRGVRRNANQATLDGVTVAVSPADANKLIVAQRSGVLSVALRGAKDAGKVEPSGESINRRQLLGLKDVPPVKPARKFTIEKYSGGNLKVIEFNDDRVQESRSGPTGRRFESEEQAAARQRRAADEAVLPTGAAKNVGQGEEATVN